MECEIYKFVYNDGMTPRVLVPIWSNGGCRIRERKTALRPLVLLRDKQVRESYEDVRLSVLTVAVDRICRTVQARRIADDAFPAVVVRCQGCLLGSR